MFAVEVHDVPEDGVVSDGNHRFWSEFGFFF